MNNIPSGTDCSQGYKVGSLPSDSGLSISEADTLADILEGCAKNSTFGLEAPRYMTLHDNVAVL